jgi:hypothetical protein
MSAEEGTTTVDDGGANARIRQLVARVKELESRVGELQPLAETAEKYRVQLDEQKAMSKAEREALRLEREIMSAGVMDAEGLEYVQHAYSKLPAEGRPSISEWMSNKEALPKAVRAYLSDTAAPTTTTTTAAPTPAPAPAPSTARAAVAAAPDAPQSWTAEAIARLSPQEFKANREAIFAALRTG